MAITITPSPNPGGQPPNVLVRVVSTSATTVDVYRQYPDGTSALVRTPDGKPLALTGSGSSYVGVINDFEAPAGVSLFYSAGGVYSKSMVLESPVPWLVHIGNPILSVPLDLRPSSFAETRRATARGVFDIVGRERPLVITTGRRRGAESSLTTATSTLRDIDRLAALIADDSILFLNVPADLGYGVNACYVSVGDVPELRLLDIGANPQRNWTLPYLVVDAPLGGYAWVDSPGGGGGGPVDPNARTMADLSVELAATLGRPATMADAAAAYATMAAAAAG